MGFVVLSRGGIVGPERQSGRGGGCRRREGVRADDPECNVNGRAGVVKDQSEWTAARPHNLPDFPGMPYMPHKIQSGESRKLLKPGSRPVRLNSCFSSCLITPNGWLRQLRDPAMPILITCSCGK